MLAKKCLLVGIVTLLSLSLVISAQPVNPATGEPLMIDCLRGTVTVDGDLSDWNLEAMTPAVLDTVEQLSSGQDVWEGVGDCSGEFYMLWDDVNIYMAVVVKDEKLSVNKSEASIWNSDCVEMFFATTEAEAEHPWTNPTIHYQYGFNADNQTWNWCNMHGPGQSVPDYLQVASAVTADGYICEASIEYAQMTALDFSAGNTIGIHPCIDDTDIDGGDTEYQMSWTGLPAHDQSLGYGHMLLSADSVAEPVEKTVLFAEDFEGLALGPNVDEELAGDAVWTDTPPEGWDVDESGIPGLGMDETDGITEWAGWAFADKAWWIEAAEDQDRSLFELASGIVAVADPDEWDDGERLPIPIAVDPYDTWLTTPAIDITGIEAGTLELKFDSSWRPEFDDNYHQTASITASFDGGDPVEVMLWESDEASDNYKPYATNETVVVDLDCPADAKRVVLTFGLFDAGNDWWWAIDNIEVRAVIPEVIPVAPGTDGLLGYYVLDGDATDSSGNGIDGVINNAETGGLGDGGSVWVNDPERGTVISFNGTAEGAYVRAGEIPQMTLTNDFTWAFWAKHSEENTADNDIILGNRMDETPADFVPRQFIKFTPTKFEWHMNGNGDDNLDYEDIPADVWLHHAVVKTGDLLTYYRNGIKSSSGTFTQPLDVPQPLYFGGDNEGAEGENWSGLMSEVCIYDRALSAGEVQYLAGIRPSELMAAFAFGSRQLDCPTYNKRTVNYMIVHQTSAEAVQYDPVKGYGYEVLYPMDSPYGDRAGYGVFGPFDDSPNSRNEFPDECPEELYDSFIGAKNFLDECSEAVMGDMNTPCDPPEGLIFRVDVPNGLYRFVAAVGEPDNRHAHRILAEDGGSGPPENIGDNYVVLVSNHDQAQYDIGEIADDDPGDAVFARVGFDGKIPPPGDGVVPSPVFVDMDENGMPTNAGPSSPVLEVTQGYIRIHQLQGNSNDGPGGSRDANGGDMVILELWRLEPETDPSLVIYYSFDEVGDIVADQSGKGHDGVVVGDVTAEADGKIGGAANFAGGGYLDLDGPNIPAEDIPTSAMTLAAWIKCANTGGDHEIFSARASDESWLIHPEPKSSGDIRWLLRSYGGTTIFQIRNGTITWDQWLHFAGTYDKETGKAALYINGELIEEMDVTDPADIAGDWDLGARVGLTIDDGRPFTGLMDEFRMYTRALSQDEILTIMQGM